MDNQHSIWDFFKARLKSPNQSVIAFRIYFWVLMVLSGLFASFISVFDTVNMSDEIDFRGISLTLLGYGMVILFSSAVEFIFIKFDDSENHFKPIKNDIKMTGFGAVVMGILILFFCHWLKGADILIFILSIINTVTILIMWWIANSRSLSIISSTDQSLNGITGTQNPIRGDLPSDYNF